MRLGAVLASFIFLTGVTPGRLFQIAASRSAGHVAASAASSASLAKDSNGAVVAVAASSGVPKAVIALSASMVKIIFRLLCSTLCVDVTMDHSEALEKQGNCWLSKQKPLEMFD